ncbi:hypothetical protein BAZSYMA_ACONTIG69168_0 [Bathymodiolus azoricus thioautotrophic gill symbiont]|uniref:Uncharacterized protein n=1 Tax=Bathymodiolus azoricus thioautotrophic gill symbiont TaxID=235205 RepID=A0A1H6L7F7_9GAMM|nr:hypothetical protein BAZSYMA_ACONTIG69168_0 [Bathymodiolus azoricus thioautotrophic gill symbiont]
MTLVALCIIPDCRFIWLLGAIMLSDWLKYFKSSFP